MEEPTEVEARSQKGLAIMEHAFSDGGKVLEFRRTSNGEMKVLDISDHHEKLQEFWDQEHDNADSK